MQFLAPIMLAGAAAISIPIALHFFYRARYKPLPWAPMRFLKEAIEQTTRRLKFQEWILLLLRCLALLLLALALARPGLKTATTAARGEALDAVFVFDASYSMAAREEGKTRLDQAKEAALGILDSLPANSSIQIFTCTGMPQATNLGPVVRFNLDQARQLIPTIEVTSLKGNLLSGLSDALTDVEKETSRAKEIYVFTDMQKSEFKRQEGAIKATCEKIKGKANLVFVRCGKAERRIANVAVTGVTLVSDIPHTRTRVPFVVTLKNTGTEPAKGIKVALELDGKALEKDATQVDLIEPGQLHPVTLTGSLTEPGVRVLSVEITRDDLPGDNVFYKLILVRDKVRVLLVDGRPNSDKPLDAGDHFVKTALNPGLVPEYYIESESVSATEASPLHLDNKDIVYLLNAPIRDANPLVGMSNEFLARLNEFVRSGGGLIIGCGDLVEGWFKLTEQSFAALRSADVPEKVLMPLTLLKDRVLSRGELVEVLTAVLDTDEKIEKYQKLILDKARTNPNPYKKSLGSDGYQLLPFDLTTIRPSDEQKQAEKKKAKDENRIPNEFTYYPAPETVAENSFVAPFRQSPFSDVLRFPIQQMFDLDVGTPHGQVLIKTTDGRPFLVSKQVGEGEVLMLTTSLDEQWCKFPSEARIFVPFTRLAIAHLTGRRAPGGTRTAGEPLTWTPPDTMTEFELVKPAKPGEKSRARVKLTASPPAEGEKRIVTAAATDVLQAGIYNIVPLGKPDDAGPQFPVFAVNPDLEESNDLAAATDSDVETMLGYKPSIVQAGASTESVVSQIRTRGEWTEWVLMLLFVLLMVEAVWAWNCGRAR